VLALARAWRFESSSGHHFSVDRLAPLRLYGDTRDGLLFDILALHLIAETDRR
jgi:hypothetical protein